LFTYPEKTGISGCNQLHLLPVAGFPKAEAINQRYENGSNDSSWEAKEYNIQSSLYVL